MTLNVSEENGNIVSSAFLQNIINQVNIATSKDASNADSLPLSFTNYQALNSDVMLAIASQAL